MLLALLSGVVCRVAQYTADQSYWHDEAAIVLNIRTHNARELLGPLDFEQAAPPMFLLAERAAFKVFGGSEFAMRLLPLAAGIGGLLLFALLARRLLNAPWDAVALASFSLADRFIWHTVEAKPYVLDLFVALLLTFLVIGPRGGAPAEKRLLQVTLAATIAMWFSYTTVLVFAALSLSLLPEIVAGGRRGWVRYALLNLPAVTSFLIVLLTFVRVQQSGVLTDYWDTEFVDLRRPWAWPWWLARHLHSLCNYALPLSGPAILAGAIAGAVALYVAQRKQLLAILAGPIVLALLAAAAHRYPFDGARLTLFLNGSVLLLAVIGFEWITARSPGNLRRVALLLPAFVVITALLTATIHLVHPRNRGHMRPVAEHLAGQVRADDVLFVLEQCEFACYWQADDPRIRPALGPADTIAAPRFWIVLSASNTQTRRHHDAILDWARKFATQRESFGMIDAEAVLFERNRGPIPPEDNQPPPIAQSPRR